MNLINRFILFFGLIIIGVGIEIIISHFIRKPDKKFALSRYLFFLLFPLLSSLLMVVLVSIKLLFVFVAFSIIGTFLEWLIGFSYHMVVGERLWTYHHFGITKYTSLLSIPLWGMCGILFWLLAQVFI